LTAQASAIAPPHRDAVGVAFVLLAGLSVTYCIAWVAFFAGARILGATRASMLSLVEPPAAALGAWLLFDETYTPLQWCGFFVVLAAIFMFEKLSYSPA
jgi:drug/metabolite transporter (DMT)-like permease